MTVPAVGGLPAWCARASHLAPARGGWAGGLWEPSVFAQQRDAAPPAPIRVYGIPSQPIGPSVGEARGRPPPSWLVPKVWSFEPLASGPRSGDGAGKCLRHVPRRPQNSLRQRAWRLELTARRRNGVGCRSTPCSPPGCRSFRRGELASRTVTAEFNNRATKFLQRGGLQQLVTRAAQTMRSGSTACRCTSRSS